MRDSFAVKERQAAAIWVDVDRVVAVWWPQPKGSSLGRVPVRIQVAQDSEPTTITSSVVYVSRKPCTCAWIDSHHGV
jgi:hypothetical protein